MPARSPAKTAQLVPNGHGGAREGAGRPRNPCAGPVTEAQIAEIAKHIPQGATRHLVPMALAVLIEIAKNGTNEAARVSAAKVLMDFYDTPLGKTFAPKSASDVEWDELLGEAAN